VICETIFSAIILLFTHHDTSFFREVKKVVVSFVRRLQIIFVFSLSVGVHKSDSYER